MAERGNQRIAEEELFKKGLQLVADDVRERYTRLLLQRQVDPTRPRGKVSLEERREMLLSAQTNRTYESALTSFDMKLKYEKATSATGRPPIGGAQDD